MTEQKTIWQTKVELPNTHNGNSGYGAYSLYRSDNDICLEFDGKCAKIDDLLEQSNITGDTSDGYHTFNELYYHRMCLFAALIKQNKDISWKSKKHFDGAMYDNFFIVGITTPTGNATYHYDLKYWDIFDCKELDNAPEWDGHTPDDVCKRVLTIESEVSRYKVALERIREVLIENTPNGDTFLEETIHFITQALEKELNNA